MEREQLGARVKREHIPAAPSAAAAPGHGGTSLHPSPWVWFKDYWGRGREGSVEIYLLIQLVSEHSLNT